MYNLNVLNSFHVVLCSNVTGGVPDIDALSDGGFCEMGTYLGSVLPRSESSSAMARYETAVEIISYKRSV